MQEAGKMEPSSSSYLPLPSSPSTPMPMDCFEDSAALPLSEELKLLLPEPTIAEDLYNLGGTSSSNPQVSSNPDCNLGKITVFPFDSAVYVEDLEFLEAQLDFRVDETVAQEMAFLGNQNAAGFDLLIEPNPVPEISIQEANLEREPETQKINGSVKEKGVEIATVSVDMIQNRRPFRCFHFGCDKTFKNSQTLKMHHRTHYRQMSDDGPVPNSVKAGQNKKIPCRCPVCQRTFVGLYELRRHFGRKHTEGEKMHICRKCGKKFYIEVDLRDHEKLCGELVGCKCGLKFAFKCNLSAHKRTHPECVEESSNPRDRRIASRCSGSNTPSLGLMGVKLEDFWGLGCHRAWPDTMAHRKVRK